MNDADVVKALAALAQESRLKVFRLLIVAGPEGVTPGRMTEELGIVPTSLSFHLKELTNAGLITQERVGRNLIYRARIAAMNDLLGFLTANCCGGNACMPDSAVDCSNC
ncbi:ArsR/SmtB family transcription factor [Ramlibacter rhizophilus]|uniref:ArsR family transcriptional regulator n=1 Tax=Ramlibacter rhizophilus TaxID=1781167 RepID=A0A4Z0BQH1_9BURK|nr:metalloregulator ArsR/SmtB family transcription factor [Ramlibacter rhizophilus]TFZ01091.1 ArsR family transcriptional regulator [Ramlibacter rhizophilus]